MAVSVYHNHYGLLDRWPVRMQESYWRFNQFNPPVGWGESRRTSASVFTQAHREALAQQIGKEFERVSAILGYFPKPTYVQDEIIRFKPRPGGVWWGIPIKVPRRNLIAFGRPGVGDPIEPTYSPKTLNDGIPGYEVTVTHTEKPSDFTVRGMAKLYNFSLASSNASVDLNDVNQRERNRVTPFMPRVEKSGEEYIYKFIIPAWNLTNVEKRLLNLVRLTPANEAGLTYDDGSWGIESDIVNDGSIEVVRNTTEEPTVKLLMCPNSNSSDESHREVEVKAEITDGKRGHFSLYGTDPDRTGYTPYAVKVSYLSGLELQDNGEMHSGIERAIFALANIGISDVTLPLSKNAEMIYNDDRENISKNDNDRFYVPSELSNPLGFKRGHALAWGCLRDLADRRYSSVSRWL